MLLVWYPRCSTCKKAKAALDALGLDYELRHIVEQPPTVEELRRWQERSGLPLKRFFNTSGIKYRELGLAKKRLEMSEDEQLTLLASDGMLIKRPLLVTSDKVLVGFKLDEYEKLSS